MQVNYLVVIMVFCVILFAYLHIQFQLKTSNDLELFEIYETTKDNMEEICDIRQPTVFNNVDDEFVTSVVRKLNSDTLSEKYPQYDVKIREAEIHTDTNNSNTKRLNNDYASLPFIAARQLMTAPNSSFYSENNADFLAETNVLKNVSDYMLRPYLTSRCEYDVIFGTEGCMTPLRYDLNYRNYYICTKGTVYIKLVPPKSTKQLNPVADYDLFEFRSERNLWLNSDTHIKTLDIALTPGKVLFIPAYWWSSFLFGENASLASFKYKTYINTVVQLPHYCMCLMQRQNVRKSFAKHNVEDLEFQPAKKELGSVSIVNDEPIVNNELVVNNEPIVNNEPVVNDEPVVIDEPIVNNEPVVNDEPIVNNEPVVIDEAELKSEPESELKLEPELELKSVEMD